jgi:hypothetical protein
MAADNTNGFTTSRLLTSSENLREKLYARNLYAPDTEYPIQTKTNVNKVVNSINTIIGGLTPFKSYNLENTFYARLITNNTPLTDIGLVMLGKQLTLNLMSHTAQQAFPIIKVSNLFDGKTTTKLFTRNVDYRITTKAEIGTFENFLDRLQFWYPKQDYPFDKDASSNPKFPNNFDYIEKTGLGQLDTLFKNVNRNIYKQKDNYFYSAAERAGSEIQDRSTLIGNFIMPNKKFYDINNDTFNPYIVRDPAMDKSIEDANASMVDAYVTTTSDDNVKQEYAPNADFVNNNMGQAKKVGTENDASQLGNASDVDMNNWVDPYSEFKTDFTFDKIVWGRDGISNKTEANLTQLRGDSDEETINSLSQDLKTGFNVRTGLLEYTRNLINASEGQIGDVTRKAFIKKGVRGSNLVGFNGAGLWRAPSTALPEFAGKKGVRQHSALDQYDRFAKAIRFNGNNVYGGNKNSVIYNTIIPQIHPVLKGGAIDNKNLMFSIENLAVGVIKGDSYGIIDDDFGSPIPLCEVGPFNGRILWFPPYNLEIVENATAKWESTVMVGRNEPMYNYQNSERTGTITFTLLVDYPEQLKGYRGKDKQKAIAEFFAFGGTPAPIREVEVSNYEIKAKQLEGEITDVEGKTTIIEPEVLKPEELKIVFPNDVPFVNDNLSTIIDKMYWDYQYEIMNLCYSSDGTKFGLNDKIFFVSGLTSNDGGKTYILTGPKNRFSQYSISGITGELGYKCILNQQLKEVFGDENNRPYYSVYVYGSASKLYTELNKNDIEKGEAYNVALGKRRADAAIQLVKKRLEAIFGKTIADGIEVTYFNGGTIGDTKSLEENATKVAIPEEDTKNERYAMIKIMRNTKSVEPKTVVLSPPEQYVVDAKKDELSKTLDKINELKRKPVNCVMNPRGSTGSNGVGDAGILHGFQSISGNYLYPVFHSQTPEDFHRRLTFLQQCTRQGSARRFATADDSGNLRARNSVFGRQPICILRIADFFYTKIIIESVNVEYRDSTWDMNPEGFGMQPMMANISLTIKILGGQSLKGPIDALQNAVSFNYYANSTYTDKGMYKLPTDVESGQEAYTKGILETKVSQLTNEDKVKNPQRYSK